MSLMWPTKKNCHRRLNISVQRTNVLYREMVYRVYCVQYTEEKAITGIKFFLYQGAFLTGSVPEKSF